MQRKIPMRQCVGCREMKAKKELVRVVRSPEGARPSRRICLPAGRMPQAGDQVQGARAGA